MKSNKGFTLVELLVYIAVLMLIFQIFIGAFSGIYSLFTSNYEVYNQVSEARIASSFILVKIRRNTVIDQIQVENNTIKIDDERIYYDDEKGILIYKTINEGIEKIEEVAEIDGFEAAMKRKVISFTINVIDEQGNDKQLNHKLALDV